MVLEKSINNKKNNLHKTIFLAHTLSLNESVENGISRSLASARVDMNPHQVEAALFALKSPLSNGVLLADEVGLGKTIEASLIIAQRWAERKRKMLLIVPSSLRSQWAYELNQKFNIPSKIVESSTYKKFQLKKIKNPFKGIEEKIIISSYEFASIKHNDLKTVNWDLVVFDEAHKLRNVWKKDGAKIAKKLNQSLLGCQKILLSATPLQNSLLELYGLISFIDPYFFGNILSFKSQFIGSKISSKNTKLLRQRLSKICNRTLRRQVQKENGLNFTKRLSLVEKFNPSKDEIELYKRISDFLQRDTLVCIKPGARHLVTLIIRKILASSTFAIQGTLKNMIYRLKNNDLKPINYLKDYEVIDETYEHKFQQEFRKKEDKIKLEKEIDELIEFNKIAKKIKTNSKGQSLLKVLKKAFLKVEELGGNQKAVIFTESRRTQEYIRDLLNSNGYLGQLILLNGSNCDHDSKKIYENWLIQNKNSDTLSGSKTADMKSAIINEFKNNASILISTESGSEGVNMQFCSILINYDLPWNPQKVEQRIGRVHRYGQKSDVLVVNFINNANKADQLVFELLEKKFQLFEGVFGASDEILGAVESEISIEKRINAIMQKCRHANEIEREFLHLNKDIDDLIQQKEKNVCKKLIDNFDEDVISKLKMRKHKIDFDVGAYNGKLKSFCSEAIENAEHTKEGFLYNGKNYYYEWKKAELNKGIFITKNNDLISDQINYYKKIFLEPRQIIFDYLKYGKQLADLKNFRGKKGWLILSKITIKSIEIKEKIILIAMTDDEIILDQKQCERLLMIPVKEIKKIENQKEFPEKLLEVKNSLIKSYLEEINKNNEIFFLEEQEKIDNWSEDKRNAINLEIKNLDKEIKIFRQLARNKKTLLEKTKAQKDIKKLEKKRDEKMLSYFETVKEVEKKSDILLKDTENKLKSNHSIDELFTFYWHLI